MGLIARAPESANVATFMVSEDARSIAGAEVAADGGAPI